MINSKLLKKKIREAGYTQKTLSEKIGISASSISLKVNNRAYFNTLEVEAICHWLCLHRDPEKIAIFLHKPSQIKDKKFTEQA